MGKKKKAVRKKTTKKKAVTRKKTTKRVVTKKKSPPRPKKKKAVGRKHVLTVATKKKVSKTAAEKVETRKPKKPKIQDEQEFYDRDKKVGTSVSPKEAAQKLRKEPSATNVLAPNALTLLDVPNRKQLPLPPELPCKLFDIIKKRQGDYNYFIGSLREGASISSACAGAGLCSLDEMMNMLRFGAQDINRMDEITDTYYSRLYNDVTRTVAITTSEVEALIRVEDPKFWLRNGPGRMFGEGWRDDPVKEKHVSHDHSGSVNMNHLLKPQKEEEANPDELLISQDDMEHALEEFAAAGLITLQPDYHTAKRIQAGEILSDDEMEALEDTISTGSDGVLELDSEGMPLLLPKPKEE